MTTINDIIAFVTEQTGHPLRPDEGVQHGPAEREIERVAVAWMATAEAIEEAGNQRAGLFIGHESLYYPYDAVVMKNPPEGWEDWAINRRRRELLERHALSFLRLHGSVDEICILDDFAARLKLGEPVHEDGFVKLYEVEACSFDDMLRRVKETTGMTAMRVSRPAGPPRPIKRIGLPWGGMGLFVNVTYQQQLLEQRCDLFIAGESDCYAFRFAAECGIGVIETSHELSEMDGLRHFTAMLAETFPDTVFRFIDTPAVWHVE